MLFVIPTLIKTDFKGFKTKYYEQESHPILSEDKRWSHNAENQQGHAEDGNSDELAVI